MKSLAGQEEDGQENRNHDGDIASRRTLVAAHHGSGMSDNRRRSGSGEPNRLRGHGTCTAGGGDDVSRTVRGGEKSPSRRFDSARGVTTTSARTECVGYRECLDRLFWVNGNQAEQGRSEADDHNSRYGRCGIYLWERARFDKRIGSGRGSKFARADRLASCLGLPCPPRLACRHHFRLARIMEPSLN